jgi:hypothetical protein
MQSFQFAISVVSMLVFGFLGWRLAMKRGRNPIGWMVAGVLFPPLLIILAFLKTAVPQDTDTALTAAEQE